MSFSDFQDYNVNVDNPQKHFDPMETYVSFRITTKVVKQNAKPDSEYIVRRRYNDFVWLRNKLIESFPTLVVPALPAKHSVLEQLDRYSRPFIMTRMAMLHSYLQRLTSHPVFSCSPVLELFLRAQSLNDVMKQSKSSQGIFDRLTDSLHTLTGFNTRNCAHPEFENIKIYVTALSQKLGSVQEVAAKINKERTEMALDFEDAQRSITHWSYQEPDLEELLKSIAEAIGTISKSQNTQLLQTYNTLIDQPLEEYCNYIDAVKEALCRRDMIQYNYESTLDDSKKKRAEKEQLENLQGSTNGFGFKLWKVTNREKIRKLQQDLPALDQLVELNQIEMRQLWIKPVQFLMDICIGDLNTKNW
ncbi:sorting nexin-30-like isoform X2 [Cimex lectularius]|uniref:PX domain-containing protein n=1 Tax=Cimex lectularius TaxID=79782 RepID=A0A8I6TIK2_CIMLE|nr:sorting nexin-30-like isoform X2 [Cimex lectularius]